MTVTTYGAINMNSLGIGVPVIERTPCKLSAKPKSNAAITAPTGLQRPKINAAKAMKPFPAVISLPNAPTAPTVKYAPPSPATNPAKITFLYLSLFTLIPTESAAVGCSPTARVRNPQRVLKSER